MSLYDCVTPLSGNGWWGDRHRGWYFGVSTLRGQVAVYSMVKRILRLPHLVQNSNSFKTSSIVPSFVMS